MFASVATTIAIAVSMDLNGAARKGCPNSSVWPKVGKTVRVSDHEPRDFQPIAQD